MRDLSELFKLYFKLVRANRPDLLQQVFHMRYLIYCHEHKRFPCFESCNPALQLERDDYDKRSVHYLCRHRPSGKYVGSVRLVLPDRNDAMAPFPTEKLAGTDLHQNRLNNQTISGGIIAEISRFCITRQFRMRRGEADTPHGASNTPLSLKDTELRCFPHPILALLVAIVRMSVEHNITHWYVLMEQSLIRLLDQFGVSFNPIGKSIEAYGPRQPCFSSIDEVLHGIYEQRPDVWRLLTDDGKLWPIPQTNFLASPNTQPILHKPGK